MWKFCRYLTNYVNIPGNEFSNNLALVTKQLIHISPPKIPLSDLLFIHRNLLWNARQYKWASLSLNYVAWHRSITLIIPHCLGFWGIFLPRYLIFAHSRQRLNYYFLSSHYFLFPLTIHHCALFIPNNSSVTCIYTLHLPSL